ncbi:Aste57867_441 [Aphanomyces stellatus]|uniref:Aste57867_441 protein n=1 Tax=Aphanomyces stellatus TaxID=120398 RepID=A0A485K3M0_9STRA|nr:hypothetical protein As57867_000440 [Aphanomyces stellatus]VFT77666.1 Aste57867_441 [Aphanomyces stellatus]
MAGAAVTPDKAAPTALPSPAETRNVEDKTTRARIVIMVVTVLTCCWVQGAAMERVLASDPSGGPLLSCFQFAAIALMTFPMSSNAVPLKYHAGLSLLYFASTRVNSLAFECGVSFPLLNLFRAASPLASLFTGYLFFGKHYKRNQILGVLLISVGICLSSWMEHPENAKSVTFCAANDYSGGFLCSLPMMQHTLALMGHWRVGIFLLFLGLVLGSLLGHLQNDIMRHFTVPGKPHPAEENMFYIHVLSLGFMFMGQDLRATWTAWTSSSLLAFVALSVVTNYLCIRAVYHLASLVSTVSLQVILTGRKAASLVFSVFYFGAPFSMGQWGGTAVLFGGVLLYANVSLTKLKAS